MKRKNSNINDYKLLKLNMTLSLFFVGIFLSISVGYALFTQVINMSGNVSLGTQGEFQITNVVKASSNNTTNEAPTWTDDSIDFNLTFVKSNEANPVYNATYNITLTNDTFYERLISAFNFNFTVNGEDEQSLGTLAFEITNFEEGEVMQPLSEKVITVTFTFVPIVDQETYDVEGGGSVESNEKPFGEITVNSMSPSTGSIKDGALQQVTVSLNSTYETVKEISFNVASDKVELVNSGGVALSTFNLQPNAQNQSFTFYIKAKSDALFPDDTLTTSLSVVSSGLPNVSLGNITLDVNKYEAYVDTTPPIISNVVAVQSNEVGVVNLTWDGEDDYSGIKEYTILVCDGSGTVINTIPSVTDDNYTVRNLSNGTQASTYNFKVYGTDNDGNTASSSDISNATTSSGYCSQSGSDSYQWVFSVTRNLNNISGTGDNSVNIGNTYTCTLRANNNYSLPDSITVKMGNRDLTSGTDYTYNRSNGSVSIPNVNGNITITATGNWSCLVEGTKVLMADGSYKNVEDIGYDDLMAVWSYNTGSLVSEYPIWIETESSTDVYLEISFSDGTKLKTYGEHGIYNYDLGMFVITEDREYFDVGTTVAKVKNGKLKLVKVTNLEYIRKEVKGFSVSLGPIVELKTRKSCLKEKTDNSFLILKLLNKV